MYLRNPAICIYVIHLIPAIYLWYYPLQDFNFHTIFQLSIPLMRCLLPLTLRTVALLLGFIIFITGGFHRFRRFTGDGVEASLCNIISNTQPFKSPYVIYQSFEDSLIIISVLQKLAYDQTEVMGLPNIKALCSNKLFKGICIYKWRVKDKKRQLQKHLVVFYFRIF